VNTLGTNSSNCALLGRAEWGLLVVHMNYWHRHPSGRVVRIGLSSRDCSRWAIWLDGVLVCDDFSSPEEAARRANERDFHEPAAAQMFRGIWVPWNLDDWRRSRPEPWTPGAVGGRN